MNALEEIREDGTEKRREREMTGRKSWFVTKKKKTECTKDTEKVKFLSLLQAPHFCQQWHLYLLNALLMLRHICCRELLLRPILGNGKKDWDVGQSAAGSFWFRQFLFL